MIIKTKMTNNNMVGINQRVYAYKIVRDKNGTLRFEHRIIMEEHLGRKLDSEEFVHHKNGNKQDNRIENLQVVTRKTHGGYRHINSLSRITNGM